MADGSFKAGGRTSDEVWNRARADYLAGLSAAEVCRRYGIGKSTFRARASAGQWRRADQPSPGPVFPSDTLDGAPGDDFVSLARTRLALSLAEGRSAEAARWLKIYEELRKAVLLDDLF